MTSIFEGIKFVKNSKGVPLIFAFLVHDIPKIQVKYSIFRGAVPDEEYKKTQNLAFIREAVPRGAVPVDCYCTLNNI